MFLHPWLLVLESNFPLGVSDKVVREGSPLHNVVGLCRLPGYRELDVALQFPTSVAYLALQLATPIARWTPGERDGLLQLASKDSSSLDTAQHTRFSCFRGTGECLHYPCLVPRSKSLGTHSHIIH